MMFPLPSGERIKVRGKIKHKKSGFLQIIGFHLLVNILCNQNGEEPKISSQLISQSDDINNDVNLFFWGE
jgi:hypothetical protein